MASLKLKRTKVKLLINNPFFASLLLKMELIESDKLPDGRPIDTACTDGKAIWFNPTYFDKLTEDEREGLFAHEVMHPALCHHTRRGNRDPKKWNYACDYAINPILKDSGITLPKGALINDRYSGKTAEEIFVMLGDDGMPDGGEDWQVGDGFDGGMGDVMDYPDMNPNDANCPAKQHEEQSQTQGIISAQIAAKQAGKGSAGIDKVIQNILDPKVDWRTHLQRLVSEKAYDDYTWMKPNRRYISMGFYLPALENETFGDVILAIDTSGSITQTDLDEYAAEVNSIQDITNSRITVIYCDTKVQHVDVFEKGEQLEFRIRGGGGTDFIPPFKWIDENGVEPKLFIYFTDGWCYSFADEPDFDTIWCINGGKDFKPPWGDTVYINN